jgi:hypothetical protein
VALLSLVGNQWRSVARRRQRGVFDPLNSNKRQPQLNEFALAQRVADGFNDIPASVSLARPNLL